MDWLNVIIMGVGLAMDCCAVSAVQGLNAHAWHPRALLMALVFVCVALMNHFDTSDGEEMTTI